MQKFPVPFRFVYNLFCPPFSASARNETSVQRLPIVQQKQAICAQSSIATPPLEDDVEDDLSRTGALVLLRNDCGVFFTGCLASLDGDGDGDDKSLARRGFDSWASMAVAVADDDGFDSFFSFALASLRSLSCSAPLIFCLSLLCTIMARSPRYSISTSQIKRLCDSPHFSWVPFALRGMQFHLESREACKAISPS